MERRERDYDTAFTSASRGEIHRVLIAVVKEQATSQAKGAIVKCICKFQSDLMAVKKLNLSTKSREYKLILLGLVNCHVTAVEQGKHTKLVSSFLYNFMNAEVEMMSNGVKYFKHFKAQTV